MRRRLQSPNELSYLVQLMALTLEDVDAAFGPSYLK